MASGDTGTNRAARRRSSIRGGRVDHLDHQADDDYQDEDRPDVGYRDDGPRRTVEPDDDYHDNDEPYDEPGPPGRRRARAAVVSAPVAARNGLRHVAELTGKAVTGVTSLDRTEQGWVVGVEAVEDRRVPSSADILAVYQTELDAAGDLVGYRRTRRYPRGRGDTGEGRG